MRYRCQSFHKNWFGSKQRSMSRWILQLHKVLLPVHKTSITVVNYVQPASIFTTFDNTVTFSLNVKFRFIVRLSEYDKLRSLFVNYYSLMVHLGTCSYLALCTLLVMYSRLLNDSLFPIITSEENCPRGSPILIWNNVR